MTTSTDSNTPVYMPGEYCEICCGTVGLGTMTLRSEFKFTVCAWCHEDLPRLKAWLAREMEKALEDDPRAVRLPDGRWAFTDAPPPPEVEG